MGSLAGVAKMMPGMAGKIDVNQIKSAEARLKKNEAMIYSMTKKERARPDLLIADPTSRSRLKRIAKGSGLQENDAKVFMSEFQKMRTMMSRMSKMMGGAGGPEDMEAAMAGGEMPGMPGNRAMRRSPKKKGKGGRGGGGGGFG
jgi:signal recognition particle subunit SRP54